MRSARSETMHGFTLVEIIIAVAIVGVLAGIAIPVVLSQLAQGNRGTADQDGAAWAVSIGHALSGYTNLGNAAPDTTSAITLSGSDITVKLDTPTPANLPSTVAVPVSVTSGSTISHSGIGTTHWCIQVANATESFVFNETGQVTSATTCNADGTTDGNTQAQTSHTTPGAPGLVTATVPDEEQATAPGGLHPYNTATISWIAPAAGTAAIAKYVVTSDPGGATCQTTGALTCDIPGLQAGARYAFNVVASNIYGDGPASDFSQRLTIANIPDTPEAPTFSSITATTVTPTWAKPNSNGAAIQGYALQYSTDPNFTSSVTTVNGTTPGSTITGLSAGTTYYYRVSAQNVVGTTPYSTSTSQLTLPGVPGNLTATISSSTSVNLTYTAPAGAVTTYNVQYSKDSTFTTGVTNVDTAGSTSYRATGLQTGSTYYFRVAAKNAAGLGAYTAPVNKTPIAMVPSAPSISLSQGARDYFGPLPWPGFQVGVTIGAPSSDGGSPIINYTMQYSTSPTFTSSNQATVTSGSAVHMDGGHTWYARVAAVTAAGTGAWSNTASLTLGPGLGFYTSTGVASRNDLWYSGTDMTTTGPAAFQVSPYSGGVCTGWVTLTPFVWTYVGSVQFAYQWTSASPLDEKFLSQRPPAGSQYCFRIQQTGGAWTNTIVLAYNSSGKYQYVTSMG